MKSLILALLSVVALNSHAQTNEAITLNTNSSKQVISLPGEVFSTNGTFTQKDDDSFAVSISVQYRSPAGKLAHYSFTYDLTDATFEQNGNDLYINTGDARILVAHHEWYYSPEWQISNATVKIKSNVEMISSRKITLNPQVIIFPSAD